jgi:hypothetical protein
VEIDTSCVVGNAPGWARITGADDAGAERFGWSADSSRTNARRGSLTAGHVQFSRMPFAGALIGERLWQDVPPGREGGNDANIESA